MRSRRRYGFIRSGAYQRPSQTGVTGGEAPGGAEKFAAAGGYADGRIFLVTDNAPLLALKFSRPDGTVLWDSEMQTFALNYSATSAPAAGARATLVITGTRGGGRGDARGVIVALRSGTAKRGWRFLGRFPAGRRAGPEQPGKGQKGIEMAGGVGRGFTGCTCSHNETLFWQLGGIGEDPNCDGHAAATPFISGPAFWGPSRAKRTRESFKWALPDDAADLWDWDTGPEDP